MDYLCGIIFATLAWLMSAMRILNQSEKMYHTLEFLAVLWGMCDWQKVVWNLQNHLYDFLNYLQSRSDSSCHVYYPFQFEVNIRKAAEQLVRLPPKTLPKPQLRSQPQHPFSVVKLRHVDQTFAETEPQPQPESPEPPASPSSHKSAIHFMTRVLHRLKEVDEHISEVNGISCFSVCFFFSVLFYIIETAACSDPPKKPLSECWLYIMSWLYIFACVMCSQMKSAPNYPKNG